MALTIITSEPKRRDFWTYDFEWVPGTMKLRLAGAFDGNRYTAYRSIADFLNGILTADNDGMWFYAHFGGMADMQFILQEIMNRDDLDIEVEASFSGASAVIVHVRTGYDPQAGKRGHVWHFVDSFWLFRDSLARIGKWIGQSKGGPTDDMSDEARRNWYATVSFAELKIYNEGDCVILHKAIARFEQVLLGLGSQLQMTIASCGLQLFRRRYLKRDIETDDGINEIARKSYFASRVEVIGRRVKDAYYYDINSSFPYAMTKPCPGDYLGYGRKIPDNEDTIFIADCDVEIPEMYLPPLPIRMKDRVFFPSGRWRAWLTSVDFRLVERVGGKIHRVYGAHRFAPFIDLRDYVLDVYRLRMESDDPFNKIVYKYLLNCLYGKFAEDTMKTALRFNPPAKWLRRNRRKIISGEVEMLFPGAYLEDHEVDVPHMHVPISSHIVANAREALYNFMIPCGEVFYCDTDGFCTKDRTLPTGTELGALKLEKRARNWQFVAPKIYKGEGVEELNKAGEWESKKDLIRAKGFSRPTPDQFHALTEGHAIGFERMERIRERLRAATGPGSFHPAEGAKSKRLRPIPEDYDLYEPGKHAITKRHFERDGSSRAWTLKELKKILG